MTIAAYPLVWPDLVKRTQRREPPRFRTTLAGSLGNLQSSLHKFARDSQMGLTDLVVSSNSTKGVATPKDPGVAVWFYWDEKQMVIPNDRYTTVEGNIQGIYKIIEARRVELRHGTLEMVRATFRGFQLPAPTSRPWYVVLGVDQNDSKAVVKRAYQKLASGFHPDRGGDNVTMADINAAWERAQWALEPEEAVHG